MMPARRRPGARPRVVGEGVGVRAGAVLVSGGGRAVLEVPGGDGLRRGP